MIKQSYSALIVALFVIVQLMLILYCARWVPLSNHSLFDAQRLGNGVTIIQYCVSTLLFTRAAKQKTLGLVLIIFFGGFVVSTSIYVWVIYSSLNG
jgi:hypothetical protein